MKKLLLTTALVGVAFVAAPAQAEVSLNLGGHFKGYVTFHNQDTATGVDERSFDMIRETEVHFTGETTLDNGLTVGFHIEAEADGGNSFDVEESYAYFAGNWGRLNVGAEDGAAYLLQVAAPAADTNIDGIRQYVNPVNYAAGVVPAGWAALAGGATNFDYAQDVTGYADKLTYITPVFNGFQAAVSYSFDLAAGVNNNGYANSFGVRWENQTGFGDAYEAAVRYEGNFNAVRLTLGAGYTHAEREAPAVGEDDRQAWNVGANLGFGPFNVGLTYKDDDNGLKGSNDTKIWVLGADYTTGPWVLGASYYDREDEQGTGVADVDTKRYSAGVTYTYGPGMTFRGSVHHIEHSTSGVGDFDATSVLLGTQINF